MSLFDDSIPGISIKGAEFSHMRESIAPKSDWDINQVTFPNLDASKALVLDIESKDPDLRKFGPGFVRGTAHVAGVAVSTIEEDFYEYYPIRHQNGQNLPKNLVYKWLGDQIKAKPSRPLVFANGLYDLEGLHFDGIQDVSNPIYDVQIAEPLLDEESLTGYSLDALGKKYFEEIKDEEMLERAAKVYGLSDSKVQMHRLPAKYVARYATQDVRLTGKVFRKQKDLLVKEDLWEVFLKESRLIPILLKMRIQGVPVDVDKAEQLNMMLKKDVESLNKELQNLCGFPVGVWENKSLVKIFDHFSIRYPHTAAGNPSFTKEFLSTVDHPAAKLVTKIRKNDKMRRDFIEAFILNMHHNGRLHCQFHQLRKDEEGTRTGRFSSSNPNLQQIPARDPVYGPMIRGLFIPEKDCRWMIADYSAQEPRLTVHFAALMKFPGAAEAARKYNEDPDTDYHQMVADMAGISRKHAKIINLGLAYGMGKKKLALDLGFITVQQFEDKNFKSIPQAALDLFEKYHESVPFVRCLMDECSKRAQSRGFIRTIWGRKRHFDLWENCDMIGVPPTSLHKAKQMWPNSRIRRAFTHKALNSLIQGSAADMLKQAVLDMADAGYYAHLLVHDEIDSSVQSEKQAKEIEEIMLGAVKLLVPLKVDAELLNNWGEAK